MRQDRHGSRDDSAVGDDLNRLAEELEQRNNALAGTLRGLIENRSVLQHTLADLEHERTRIEQARREWMTALDAVRDPIFIHDKDMKVVRANRAYAERAGRDIHDVIGRRYWEMFPRLDGPLAGCRRAVEEQQATGEELQIAGGETFVCRNYPIRDAAGKYLYSLHLLQDVTAQRKAEVEQRRLAMALQQAGEAIIVTDAEARIRYVNPAYSELFGYALEEVAGQPVTILSAPGASTAQPDEITRQVRADGHFRGPVLRRAKDGALIPVQLVVSTMHGASGEIEGFIGTMTDLRDLKRTEQALRESEEKFRRLVETTTDWIWQIDEHGVYTYVSPQVRDILGYAPEEIVGKTPYDLMSPAEAEKIRDQLQSIIAAQKPFKLLENVNLHKDGHAVVLETSGTPLFDPTGAYKGCRGIDRDISERKRAEESLLDLNRMLKTLSACNAALVHAASEPELLEEICRISVHLGGYRLAWVGFATQDEARRVVPQVAVGVVGLDVLQSLHMTWDDGEHGRGPTSRAIRTLRVQVVQDVATDAGFDPWRELICEYGIASAISLPLRGDGEFFGALSIYAGEPNAFDAEEVSLLTELADDLAFGIHSLRTRQQRDKAIAAEQRGLQQLRESLEATIGAVAATVEMRDPYTAGHERRVAHLASAIAREMGLPQDRIEGIHFGALIHDLGKVKIPSELLSKPTALTKAEFELVKEHTQAGYDILKGVKFPWPVAEMALQHHEHVDGSGYPNGLKGDEMLLESRILAVADTVEAMSSHRPYRPALGIDAALAEITQHRGTYYDSTVVDVCLRLFQERGFTFAS